MAADKQLKIPLFTWAALVKELRRRGQGQRESGAFLLGHVGQVNKQVVRFVCYDDLDPNALKHGVIAFHAQGYSALWELCRRESLEVVADVHTHPTGDVRQSPIDANNPMLAVAGHIGLILPYYGVTSRWSLSGVGIHVFLGGGKWKSCVAPQRGCPVGLSAW